MRDVAGTLLPTRFEVWELLRENYLGQNAMGSSTGILAGRSAVKNLKRLREATPGLPVEFYRDEVDNIRSCFFACVGDQSAAIAWSYDHTKPSHFLRMSSGDTEIRSVYSLAQFRGRGLAKSVIAMACESLAREGYRRIYAVVHFRNEASLRAFRSIGFTKVAELNRPPLFGPRYITEAGQAESWLRAVARSFRFWRFRPAPPSGQR